MRILAAVVLACLCIALGAVQALSSIALRAAAQPGAWSGFVPAELSARVDRLGPAVPLPPELHLVLAREALARGDVSLAERDAAGLPASRDRLVLEGGIAEARGDSNAAVRAYLQADDLSGLEHHIDELVTAGRVVEAVALERVLIARLAADRTQVDALAQAYFDLGRSEETRAYQIPVGQSERHAHEVAAGDAYAHALALAPLEERYLLAFGNQQLNLADLPAAERTFERARDVDPTSAEPLAGLGDVAFRQGDAAGARSYLARARALDPGSAAVRTLALKLGVP